MFVKKFMVHTLSAPHEQGIPKLKKDYAHVQCVGIFLDINNQYPIISKSNWLHIVIFQFFFNNLRYVPHIPLNWSVVFLKVLNFNRLLLKLD